MVTEYVPVQKALDPKLTEDIPEPAAPAWRCKDSRGKPTVCHKDLVNNTEALRTWGRKLQGKLKEIRGLQPPAESP